MTRFRASDLFILAALLALTLGTGWLGSRSTIPEITGWYAGLAKPSFNPPDSVFGPVWTALYVLMAVSAWLVWRAGGRAVLALFALQLALNALWTQTFFGWHALAAAVLVCALLWLAELAMVLAFARHDRRAAWLNVPLLLWTAYATALSFTIWRLNG